MSRRQSGGPARRSPRGVPKRSQVAPGAPSGARARAGCASSGPGVDAAIPRYRLIFKVGAYTGLRESELCGLSWNDVDFVERSFFIHRVWRRGRFKVPKTDTSVRHVEFPASLVTELKAHKLACPKGDHQLVFPTETGGPMNPANLLHRGFYPALRRAGVRKVRFHDLRHSFASLALAGGENVAPVSKQLGHASTAITMNVYRHVLPGEGRGMSDRLAARVVDADGGEVVANAPSAKPGAA